MGSAASRCIPAVADGKERPLQPTRRAAHMFLRLHFHLWCSAHHRARAEAARHATALLDARLARTLQVVADHEATISRLFDQIETLEYDRSNEALAAAPGRTSQTTCRVCADDASEGCRCTCGHFVCFACVGRHCDALFNALDDRAFGNRLACIVHDGCRGTYDFHDLMHCIGGARWVREVHHRASLKLTLDVLSRRGVNASAASLQLRFLRYDGTYRALACPKCLHGPLEHAHCDDLVEWHERAGRSNACPMCKHAARSAKDLKRWNGESDRPPSSISVHP